MNEITVKIKCPLQEIYNILENKNFKIVDKYYLEDIYYTNKNIKEQPIEELLKEYVLIRKVTQFIPENFKESYEIIKYVYKTKQIDKDGTIINQSKKECTISSIKGGKEFIESLGYKEIMTIKEQTISYGKGDLHLDIKNIPNNDNLIEIETVEANPNLNTIDKLKNELNKLNLPIDTNNYFVKKTELELEKIIKNDL